MILIVVYTLIVLVQFALEDSVFVDQPRVEQGFFKVELAILAIFIIEILMHLVAFKLLYLKDYWNILDIFVILLSVVFVILDINLSDDNNIKGVLKLRGIFRLLRVFLLVRKLNTVRVRREARKKIDHTIGDDFRSPVEKVLEILTNIRDNMIEQDAEEFFIKETNYCIS